MRSLNTSLPTSPPKQRPVQPPEELLQAFKSAALSVTNLYKTAASGEKQSRQAGYQEALDELLGFLDKENLGLGDGEGWRVRQWATERLDDSLPAQGGSDTDDERGEPEKRATSPSLVLQRKSGTEVSEMPLSTRSVSPSHPPAHFPVPPLSATPTSNPSARSDTFSFKASIPFPPDVEMQASDGPTPSAAQSEPSTLSQSPPAAASPASVRVEVVPRGSRSSHRHASYAGRHNTRSLATTRALGNGAGTKRKIALNDFFDLGNFGDGKDANGGSGKRGRLG